MKKIVLGLFILLSSFVLIFTGVKTKAVSAPVMVTGASIRATGERQGLKFSATVDSLEGVTEHGFYVALGTHTQSAMATAAGADANSVGGKKLKKVEVTGSDTTFHAVVYNIPEASYGQVITAIAYVSDGSTKTFSSTVSARNIEDIAYVAKTSGVTSDLINTIVEHTNDNYMFTEILDTDKAFVISPFDNNTYNYANISAMWADFIADYNEATGATLTTSSTITQFHTSLATGIASNSVRTFSETSNAVKFFSGKNLVKWGWILDYFKTYGSTVHITNQATGLLRNDRTCQSYDGHRLRHLGGSIYNLFNKSDGKIDGMATNSFTTEDSYVNVWKTINACHYNQSTNKVLIGNNVTLPEIEKRGYSLNNYTKDASSYAALSSYEVTDDLDIFKATYDIINYTITYNLNDGSNSLSNPSSYTVETASINLANATKSGYVFAGWYGNSSFTGDPIESINKGSIGNVVLYAKYIREVSVVNPAWSAESNGTIVTYDAVNYTIGTDAFSTITSAIAAASEYEQIYVLAGTYEESFTISTNGITLLGPNNEIDAVNGVRETEAILTGKITLTTAVQNTTISGFKFTNGGQIYTTSSSSGTAVNSIHGFNFLYNYVDKGANTTPVIYLDDGDKVYPKDVVIDYCYFTAPSLAAVTSGKYGLVFIYNSENLTIKHSKFYNIPKYAIGIYDTTNGKGLGGDLIVEDNIFDSISTSAIWVNYYGPLSGTDHKISIKNNYFKSVNTDKATGVACIDLEESDTGATYASIRVELNVFEHTFYCLWSSKSAGIVFTNNVIYKYDSSNKTIVAKGTSGYSINCASNLYLAYDGSSVNTTVKSTDGSTGYEFNNNVTNVDASNYASIDAYNTATGKSFSAD